jgi:hypothetical protein
VHLELGQVTIANNPWTGGAGSGRDDWFTRPPSGSIQAIRHAVVVVPALDRALRRWKYLFGMEPVFTNAGPTYQSAILPFANNESFIEVREPMPKPSDERSFLESSGGGLFSVMIEVEDADAVAQLAKGNVERLSHEYPGIAGFRLDPSTLGGVRLEVASSSGNWFAAQRQRQADAT